ncbi:hypothetical protein EDB85DRAFT_2148849 [Lactarius pseudohatsudake]|nr:hypothetical protein EDB85DRAFT_2148849 [Lactarius pseudohatsudake]
MFPVYISPSLGCLVSHRQKFDGLLQHPPTTLLLPIPRAEVEKWLKKWEIAPPEEGAFLEHLVGALPKQGGQDMAHHYELAHVRSLDPAT